MRKVLSLQKLVISSSSWQRQQALRKFINCQKSVYLYNQLIEISYSNTNRISLNFMAFILWLVSMIGAFVTHTMRKEVIISACSCMIFDQVYFNIQIMSKKPQPQNKDNPKHKPQIVDQQNEPFLKTLAKRVRNINKKLTQITELEAKPNLKPEQVEKINRKNNLLEERSRVQETANLFKETYVENLASYRAQQLRQLQILARGVAIYHSGAKIAEGEKLSSVWRAIERIDHSSVNESIESLSNVLKDFANDRKLQKALSTYVQEHGDDKITEISSNDHKIASQVPEEKPLKIETQKQEEKLDEPARETIVPPVVVSSPATVGNQIATLTEKTEESPKAVLEEQTTPITEEIQKQQGKTMENGQKQYKQRRDNREQRENRGNYRGGRREGEGERKERKQYKPRYQAKQADEPKEEESNSDSEPEVRRFRNEEIKQLESDGFIVIGKAKPKPKPKNPKQQLQFHDRQHGKKHHHHNNPASNHQ